MAENIASDYMRPTYINPTKEKSPWIGKGIVCDIPIDGLHPTADKTWKGLLVDKVHTIYRPRTSD